MTLIIPEGIAAVAAAAVVLGILFSRASSRQRGTLQNRSGADPILFRPPDAHGIPEVQERLLGRRIHQVVDFNIKAVDARSVAQMLRQQKGTIADVVREAAGMVQDFDDR